MSQLWVVFLNPNCVRVPRKCAETYVLATLRLPPLSLLRLSLSHLLSTHNAQDGVKGEDGVDEAKYINLKVIAQVSDACRLGEST